MMGFSGQTYFLKLRSWSQTNNRNNATDQNSHTYFLPITKFCHCANFLAFWLSWIISVHIQVNLWHQLGDLGRVLCHFTLPAIVNNVSVCGKDKRDNASLQPQSNSTVQPETVFHSVYRTISVSNLHTYKWGPILYISQQRERIEKESKEKWLLFVIILPRYS